MSSYEETIINLQKQVNDFSKYIKPEDNVQKNDGKLSTSNNTSISSIKNNENIKYIIIPIGIIVLLVIVKPNFVMVEQLVDNIKVKKLSYVRVVGLSIVISILFYLFLKNKKSLLNKK